MQATVLSKLSFEQPESVLYRQDLWWRKDRWIIFRAIFTISMYGILYTAAAVSTNDIRIWSRKVRSLVKAYYIGSILPV